jgi:ASC-1-like (ASCH) protein
MDHIVYLDCKAKELENLKKGAKTMIVRGAMGRKLPYGKVTVGDVLYFIENKGDGMIKAKATVANVFNSEQLTKEESMQLIEKNQPSLLLDGGLLKRFAGKRYLVLITIHTFAEIEHFRIDRSAYGNMDDWLPVGNIDVVRINN